MDSPGLPATVQPPELVHLKASKQKWPYVFPESALGR